MRARLLLGMQREGGLRTREPSVTCLQDCDLPQSEQEGSGKCTDSEELDEKNTERGEGRKRPIAREEEMRKRLGPAGRSHKNTN